MAPKAMKAANTSTLPVKGKEIDIGAIDKILERWNAAKLKEEEAKKEIESCKTQVESAMLKTGMETLKTSSFQVDKRTQSRESCSKKDLPSEIWKKYAKTSTFTVLAFKRLGGKAPKAAAKAKGKATKK
eukprot:TRINITY_DN104873_c0_g1_i1.p1 TRINITY_DN104873_c0_g1~~TRINITY_DN104873_c0_g1_i1.p1  ORF type:complete len:129 (-),score=58.32 TRINITY_DN104873_c0_g1_i1:191-577(-)